MQGFFPPGVPIPNAAVHGIDDALAASAPSFLEVGPHPPPRLFARGESVVRSCGSTSGKRATATRPSSQCRTPFHADSAYLGVCAAVWGNSSQSCSMSCTGCSAGGAGVEGCHWKMNVAHRSFSAQARNCAVLRAKESLDCSWGWMPQNRYLAPRRAPQLLIEL
jgi:hypothetical protein